MHTLLEDTAMFMEGHEERPPLQLREEVVEAAGVVAVRAFDLLHVRDADLKDVTRRGHLAFERRRSPRRR